MIVEKSLLTLSMYVCLYLKYYIVHVSQVQNLYSVCVFENNLFVSSWHNNSIRRVHRNDQEESITIVQNISRPFSVHVFHRQRQPDGEYFKPLKHSSSPSPSELSN